MSLHIDLHLHLLLMQFLLNHNRIMLQFRIFPFLVSLFDQSVHEAVFPIADCFHCVALAYWSEDVLCCVLVLEELFADLGVFEKVYEQA